MYCDTTVTSLPVRFINMKISYILALPVAFAAPIISLGRDAEIIPGKYIVVLKPSTSSALLQTTLTSVTGLLGARPQHVYDLGSFKGFSVSATEALIQTVANIGAVRDEMISCDP